MNREISIRLLRSAILGLTASVFLTSGLGSVMGQQRDGKAAGPAFQVPFGQRFDPQQFADPAAFFDRMFGKQTEAQRAAINKIKIDPRQEQRFGDRAIRDYLSNLKKQGLKVETSGRDVDYLSRLVNVLRPQMRNARRYRKIRVYVVRSDKSDARSFPGGHLVFFSGIIDFADNEAGLMGIVGHELSHLDRQHQLRTIKQSQVVQKSLNNPAAFSPEKIMATSQMAMQMFMRPFRPEDESEADRDGVDWLFAAGYDPQEFGKLLLNMHRRDQQKLGQQAGGFQMFRSHPFHIDRYRAITQRSEELIAQRAKPVADAQVRGPARLRARRKAEAANRANNDQVLYVGKENLKQRLTRDQRRFRP